MVVTVHSFTFALAFLFFGVLALAAVNQLVYPRLRWRYEAGKMRARRRIDPNVLVSLVKLLGLIVMPIVGFWLGSMVSAGQ
jgi:Mn2+/Fe2+ NRAMP family transporter